MIGEAGVNGRRVNIAWQGRYYSSFSADAVEVYGQGGTDTLTANLRSFQGTVLMSGGAGNDLLSVNGDDYWESTLMGGSGRDVLVGGRWTDRLNGGSGQDVLIGGMGADFLYGGDNDDLLIPGYTGLDSNLPALRQIRNYWSNGLSYNQRVEGLLYGRNGYVGSPLNQLIVHTDLDRDEMWGDAGMDRFYSHYGQDDVRDTGGTGERLTNISGW